MTMPSPDPSSREKARRYLAMKIYNAGGSIHATEVINRPGKIGSIHLSWIEEMIQLKLIEKKRNRYYLTAEGQDLAQLARDELPPLTITPRGHLLPFPQWAFPPIYNRSTKTTESFLTQFECLMCKQRGEDYTDVWGGYWDARKGGFLTTCNKCNTKSLSVPSKEIVTLIRESKHHA